MKKDPGLPKLGNFKNKQVNSKEASKQRVIVNFNF